MIQTEKFTYSARFEENDIVVLYRKNFNNSPITGFFNDMKLSWTNDNNSSGSISGYINDLIFSAAIISIGNNELNSFEMSKKSGVHSSYERSIFLKNTDECLEVTVKDTPSGIKKIRKTLDALFRSSQQ